MLRPYTREEVEARGDWFHDNAQVKMALFRRWGILPAAGDRHLVEFLPGFTRSPETLFRWGVIRTPVSYRIERWREAPRKTLDLMAGREPLVLDASGEEGVAQMRALLGLGDLVTNVNVENRGQVADLPLGAVVETNARFSRDEVRPLAAGSLPPGVQPLVARHVANQEMIVEAALSRDRGAGLPGRLQRSGQPPAGRRVPGRCSARCCAPAGNTCRGGRSRKRDDRWSNVPSGEGRPHRPR